MNLTGYWGKHVNIIDIDGEVYQGFVQAVTIPGDSDENCYEIDLVGTKQYPEGPFNLTEHEIKSIEFDSEYNKGN
ncbi:hypothetical protein FC40_GL000498 [Ligilactobacillus hayakitensis DSM 18933 = JCM 14209]|uniref:Uncharacterized protein n=1 Tax=Ligilactobacillus hayakitensis DSM 18933 = JCM 14209 TaxID=1423755 RepID=A0A0R1WN84_9LACO|nr:hypothetical protein [Ligilactobacillus hayakitensis]KRM19199.1 hypothetical protein FC40_GL000498 [Ligilactobacillus hayakitensis DSM 18933 = JCM 14209]